MKLKRAHLISLAVTVVVLLFYSWWIFFSGDIFRSTASNAQNRAALLRIYEVVNPGASHAEVLAAYWEHRTGELRLYAEEPDGWSVGMPLEFGATDWGLLIEFEEGKVSAVRVRTSDGPAPEDGPADKGR